MECEEAQELLSVYSDGELDLMRSLELETHLTQCVVCSEKFKTFGALHNLTASTSLYYSAPQALRDRIQTSLLKENAAAKKWPVKNLQWLAYAASFALVFFLGWLTAAVRPAGNGENVQDEILSSHVRSLMPGHLTDVLSSDRHTVKPWFNGKLDFSPTVKDFAAEGFPLLGGRLDYVDHRSVVALVYSRDKHIINVYLWPAETPSEKDVGTKTLQGYNIVGWVGSGANHYVISDLNEKELQRFVKLLRAQ